MSIYTFTTASLTGSAVRGGTLITWANVHDGVGTNAVTPTGQFQIVRMNDATYGSISRLFILFDTSSIPDTEIITSATFSLYFYDTDVHYGDPIGQQIIDFAIALVGSTPASDTTIVAADYQNMGVIRYANIDIPYFKSAGVKTFTLNAAGLAAISKTGKTKFGLRMCCDVENRNVGLEDPGIMCIYSIDTSSANFFLTVNTISDSGIRYFNNLATVKVATSGIADATSKVRFFNGTSILGLPLVNDSDINASPIKVYDGVSIKVLPKIT